MRNVEGGKLGIDVSIDDREQIDASESKDAQVSEPAEGVLLALEDALEALFFACDVVPWSASSNCSTNCKAK